MLKKTKPFMSSMYDRSKTSEQPNLKEVSEKLELVQSNQVYTRIHQLVQSPWGDGSSQTLLFSAPIVTMQNARKRYLVLKNITYLISNWTFDEFPNTIYICLKDFIGYSASKYDLNTNVTTLTGDNRIAALQIKEVQAVMDQSNLKTYEIKYELKDVVSWDLPLAMTKIDLSIKIDGSPVAENLPLPNPMVLNIQIRQEK